MADSHEADKAASPSPWAIGLLAAGVIALIVSFFWPSETTGHGAWPPEKAKAFQDASIKLHSLSQQGIAAAGSEKEKKLRQDLARADTEFKALKSELDAAIDQPKHIKLLLRICGTLTAIVGLGLIYRGAGPSDK